MANENDIASLILPVTADEYEKLGGSKFPAPGLHLSEITNPIQWKTKGKSVVFKFRVIEQGEDSGKDGELTAGIEETSAWKFKECQKALGMTEAKVKTKDGAERPKFDPVEALGKQFYSEWVPEEYQDEKTGQIKKYVKCLKFWDLKTGARMAGALPADEESAVEEVQ
jgi:hypothetical protein